MLTESIAFKLEFNYNKNDSGTQRTKGTRTWYK